jgi:hypothetical protein
MEASHRDRWLALTYTATIFTSAFLLFQIQPLISKYLLPWFGGSPAVWTTCLLFFQTLLFAGYAYAHFSHGRLQPKRQANVHLALVAAAAIASLIVLPSERWQPHSYADPVRQILFILAISVGLPYFVLSATGPLLQAWFARSFPGRIPYRLYALSNLGSLLALVSYPFFFEWAFDLPRQAAIWSVGFVAYALLCGYAAWRVRKSSEVAPPPRRARRGGRVPQSSQIAPPWVHRVLWLVWPALASVVLLATTNHISTDIAAVPFLWVVPLALYLVTFIVAFDRPNWYRRAPVAVLVLLAVYAAAFVHSFGVGWKDQEQVAFEGTSGLIYSYFLNPDSGMRINSWQFFIVNFVATFAICMLCHGELVRLRPDPRYLTSFYLMIAAGGALGGVFVTLLAPKIFLTYFEWELSLFIACILAIGFLLRAMIDFAFSHDDNQSRRPFHYLLLAAVILAVFLPSAVILLDMTEFLQPPLAKAELRLRNFFGTLAVLERGEDDPLTHNYFLRHGAITHGAQYTHPTRRSEPTTYYGRTSGVARTIDYYRRNLQEERMKLGVVGLGTGTLAAYADGGDSVTFYEINPAVVGIAESGNWFTYLEDCRTRGATCEIHLGDARLELRRELASVRPPRSPEELGGEPPATGQQYHVLVLDAFSGDAIPVHLLTAEACELYLAHLSKPLRTADGEVASATGANSPSALHGAIAVHISNRYLNLEPVVRGLAQHFGLLAVYVEDDEDDKLAVYSSDWVILTRNKQLADELSHFADDSRPAASPVLWTDNRSSLFEVLK